MSEVVTPGRARNPDPEIFRFLTDLFGRASLDSHIVIWERVGKRSQSFPVADLEAASTLVAEWGAVTDTYVGRAAQASAPLGSGRGDESGVASIGGLFADIDTREGAHAATELPADAPEALAIIAEAGLPPPTLVIHTGGGLHAHWLFDAVVETSTEQARAEAKALSAGWQARLRSTFAARGYKLDSTHDLARVVRIPGTMNHKDPAAPKPVQVIARGPRLSLDAAKALIATATPRSAAKPVGNISRRLEEEKRKEFAESGKRPEIAPILTGCGFLQQVDSQPRTVTEPDWYAALSIVGRCRDGERLAHQMSAGHPNYSGAETKAKLEHALKDAGPATCAHIAEKLQCGACQRCPFLGTIASPISLGYQPENIVEVQRETVFSIETETYLNIATGVQLPPSGFAAKVRARVGRGPHDKLTGSKTMPMVDHFDYVPGDGRLIIPDAGGTKRANTWRHDGVEAVPGDASVILAHFGYLFPDEVTHEHVLDYLAHVIQRPGEKIGHGLIITGGFGVGKSTVAQVITTLIGRRNTTKLEGEELGSRWTSRLVNTQALIVEEAMHGERYEVYERLKELVTGETFTVEEKHVRRHLGRTPRGIFLLSNHDAPLVLPKGDRRFFVAATTDTPAPAAHFETLYRAMGDQRTLPAFAAWLSTRNISRFNAKAPPPMTVAKARATEASRTPMAQVLGDLVHDAGGPFARDVLSIETITHALLHTHYDVGRLTSERIGAALKSLGAFKREGAVRLPGKPNGTRLWAIRNVDRWRDASAEEWRVECIGKEGDGATIHELPAAVARAVGAAA